MKDLNTSPEHEFGKNLYECIKELHGFALSLTNKNEEDARDLEQDTFARAWEGREHYKILPGIALKPWVLTIMKNIFINQYRKRKKQPYFTTDQLPDKQFTKPICGYDVNKIESVINALPDPTERTIMLMRVQGYKYKDIAKVTRLAVGTVKTKMHYIRYGLKLELAEMLEQ